MDDRAQRVSHERLREWLCLDREPEGLPADERSRLSEHLEECSECRREAELYARLDARLAAAAVPVREGFRADVMRSLPPAGWESRARRAWRLPIAVLLLLGAAAGWLIADPAAGGGAGALAGAAAALGDMAATGILAASGLLWASWRGFGLALDAHLTPAAALALFVLVVSLDVLLLSVLVRRAPAAERAGRREGPPRF